MHARADRTNETSVVSPAGSYSVVFRTVIPHVSGEAVGLGPVQWVDIEIFSNLTIIMRLIDAAGDFRFALEFFFCTAAGRKLPPLNSDDARNFKG